jgi:hypothetical protein
VAATKALVEAPFLCRNLDEGRATAKAPHPGSDRSLRAAWSADRNAQDIVVGVPNAAELAAGEGIIRDPGLERLYSSADQKDAAPDRTSGW